MDETIETDSETQTPGACPRCGVALPPDAPEELCPRCLMAANLEGDTVMTGEVKSAAAADAAAAEMLATDIESLQKHFPQLEIFECLGRGGMGVVYRARQKSLNREVALKILAPERAHDSGFAERFQKEAHALAAMNHPNIVTVFDFGEAGGFYFLLMEYVDGVNLRQAMSAGRFTPEEALSIVPPVCEALEYAHDHGVVHRDIKPENLLLDREGRVMIADFGVAKMVGPETVDQSDAKSAEGSDGTFNDSASMLAGTPRYMAPEQAADSTARADHRVDIYALGVVLYELLTGETPNQNEIAAPSRKVDVDVRIDEIVLRALEAKPELRYATAAEFRTRVESATSGAADFAASKPETKEFDSSELKSSAQRFARICLPRSWFESMRRESLEWKYEGDCGHGGGKSVWDSGGIRWKASGNPKRWLFCSECGDWKWFTLRRDKSGRSATEGSETRPVSKGRAWTWTVFTSLLSILGIMNVVAVMSETVWQASFVFRTLAIVGSVGACIFLFKRTQRLLREAESSGNRLQLAPPWFGWAALVFAGLSGLFGGASLIQTGGDVSKIHGLILAFAVLGLWMGILSRKTPVAILAIVFGGVNLMFVATMMIISANQSGPAITTEMTYPSAAHIGRNDGSMMVHSRDGELDYVIYSEGSFNSSSAGSQNRHSLSWIENDSIELIDSGWTFGYLRESVDPTALHINGAEYDLRNGRVFSLEASGQVTQWELFPELDEVELPSDVSRLISQESSEPKVQIRTDEFTLEADSIKIGIDELEETDDEKNPVAKGAKVQRFVPEPGTELRTSWSVYDKPSHINPDGWAVMAHMTLGGTAKPILPGDSEPAWITLLKGDQNSVTIEVRDEVREQTMTTDLLRDRPAEMTINGKGYRILYPTTQVAAGEADTTSTAIIFVTPAGQPK